MPDKKIANEEYVMNFVSKRRLEWTFSIKTDIVREFAFSLLKEFDDHWIDYVVYHLDYNKKISDLVTSKWEYIDWIETKFTFEKWSENIQEMLLKNTKQRIRIVSFQNSNFMKEKQQERERNFRNENSLLFSILDTSKQLWKWSESISKEVLWLIERKRKWEKISYDEIHRALSKFESLIANLKSNLK